MYFDMINVDTKEIQRMWQKHKLFLKNPFLLYLISMVLYFVFNNSQWIRSFLWYHYSTGGVNIILNSTFFGSGSGPIWMDNLGCDGTEDNIDKCTFNGWNVTDCGHSEDVGVACDTSGVTAAPTAIPTTRPPPTVQPNNCSASKLVSVAYIMCLYIFCLS